jgi:protein phosphatase
MSLSSPHKIPKLSLVVLIGASGSGKSTFAKKHFLPTEVISSDTCRGLVSDDENSLDATSDAFDVLYYIARKRLAAGRLTVIDATNVQPESRKLLVALAREFHVLPVAIVLNLPEKVCQTRNENRSDRNFGPHVIRNQRSSLRRSLRRLKREGFRHVHIMESVEEVDAARFERVPLWNDKTEEHGPFDFIGDVHGCYDELESLLVKLGYQEIDPPKNSPGWSDYCFAHPEGRKVVFVGDLIDRGPRAVDCLSVVRNMVRSGNAICVPGNHDVKLLRKLRGKDVAVKHGLAETLADIDRIPAEDRSSFQKELAEFLDSLISHYVLDDGKVVVAHAGLPQHMHGRGSGKVRSFALYGETTGEIDEFGLPVRHNWASDYRGDAMVVYGHTPIPVAQWLNKTIDIDTGCVFGGKLTALRYPEQELVDVRAIKVWCEPAKPLALGSLDPVSLTSQQIDDDLLDADDVIGKRIVSTRLRNNITIKEQNSTAALEVMSRFAADPKWLIYLPPTMSPCESSSRESFLEYPTEAFDYYRKAGVETVVCEEKHMGSRAVVVACRDAESAKSRFGIETGEQGIVYTRTGRRFFNDLETEGALISRLAKAMEKSGFWDVFETNWVCLDCELMPWSAKAQDLLQNQYAAVGAAARQAVPAVVASLQEAAARLESSESVASIEGLLERFSTTGNNVEKFTNAYRQYCWPVDSIEDLRLAPFHILATEKSVHVDRDHLWHMSEIAKFCEADSSHLFFTTRHLKVDLSDPASVAAGENWWRELTSTGGEGMVVKPLDFIELTRPTKGRSDVCQPAVKVRGSEYLRIIYGPDYDTSENLSRLRQRHLGRKRSLAIREFALGIEALERFVAREPLRKVHECVFGVLALESEPVDPRL